MRHKVTSTTTVEDRNTVCVYDDSVQKKGVGKNLVRNIKKTQPLLPPNRRHHHHRCGPVTLCMWLLVVMAETPCPPNEQVVHASELHLVYSGNNCRSAPEPHHTQ